MPQRWLLCGIATLVLTAAASAQQDTARAKLVTGQL
jgi:hypothetical protein